MKNDRHVVIRPKGYVDSSGNTWANETERLHLLYPDEFEAKNLGKSYSKHFHSLCAAVHDDVFLYVDMTEEGDILKVTTDSSCKHRLYEQQRLGHLAGRVEKAELQWNINCALCSEFEKLQGNKLLSRQKDVIRGMTPNDFELYEQNRMSKNAWRVADIVRERVDDAAVLGDFISALLAEKNDSGNFFFNKPYVKEHQNAAQQKKSDVPGSTYIEKILEFIAMHYKIGELF
ncbi:hypothetical protein ACROYT_G014555 [Oculina patagonica]